MMIPNIFPNYFSSYFIPYCSGKIPIFPKFPTPKLLLYFRMFLKITLALMLFNIPTTLEMLYLGGKNKNI